MIIAAQSEAAGRTGRIYGPEEKCARNGRLLIHQFFPVLVCRISCSRRYFSLLSEVRNLKETAAAQAFLLQRQAFSGPNFAKFPDNFPDSRECVLSFVRNDLAVVRQASRRCQLDAAAEFHLESRYCVAECRAISGGY